MKPAHAAASWRNPLRDKRDKRLPRIAGPCGMVIFGVTGDLARKKVMPAVYDLANRGLLPPTFSLVGFARRDWSTQDFGQVVYNAVQEHCRTPFRQQNWDRLAEGFRFVPGTFDDDDAFAQLAETLEKLDAERGTGGNHAFYLAIPPKSFPVVCEQLHKSGLARPQGDRWSRVVIEKPFGHDLASARELNKAVNAVFPEEAVFRIDHYLGKETVQNILALRFANQLFDPIWNAHYVDHVQITMAESIEAANDASHEHPSRIIVTMRGDPYADRPRLDAQLRVGADAGAGEFVVLRLSGPLAGHADSVVIPFLLPDIPVVAWWPDIAPAVPAQDALGKLAIRRITDATNAIDPLSAIKSRLAGYGAGDTDLAWSRITYWRALLTSAVDQPPHEPIESALVSGLKTEPALDVLAGWLASRIEGPVRRAVGELKVELVRNSETIVLSRPQEGITATLTRTGKPDALVPLARRVTGECLAEDLRRLDPDEIYCAALEGIKKVQYR